MKRNSELVYVAAWVMSLNEDENNQPGNEKWDPPVEMEQFVFLVGEWEGRGFIALGEDSIERECTVQWRAQKLLDGWAIQDEISIFTPNGRLISRSTLLRTYSADMDHWKVVELSLPGQQITEFRASREGDSMVMFGERADNGTVHHIRIDFYDIYRDSFKMRMTGSRNGSFLQKNGLRFVMKRK